MIGKLIKIFRKEKGIGVIELSKKLGINRISLFRIEKEQREPSEETAIKAFKIFGLSEENIYHIFVFNELQKLGKISPKSRNQETQLFLKRLNKKDKNSKIMYRYFKEDLNINAHAKIKRK